MSSLFVELTPMILGSALAPLWITIVLLLLASPRGVAKAAGFVLGMTLARLAQGAIFGFILAGSPEAEGDASGTSPVAATLMLVLGVLLLVAAYRKWSKAPDPDEPPPQWMAQMEQMTPGRAFVMGFGLVMIGVKLLAFTLSALGVIRAADLSDSSRVIAYLAYVALAQLLLIVPIVAGALAPKPSAAVLRRIIRLLEEYNRPITIGVSLVFGLYFGWKGLMGLIG